MFKRILKIAIVLLVLLLVALYIALVYFTSPKSDDTILASFEKSKIKPIISKEKYKGFDYRKIAVVKDTVLPTVVFVHGTIGSLNDFNKYMIDEELQNRLNMISYDRIGYNYHDKNPVQESIAFERDMLLQILKSYPKNKLILVGYSYGGPIALSVKQKLRQIVLLAPAVMSKVEPMPWAINFYKWRLTRWLVPYVWKQASKEKISHKADLKKFEKEWYNTPNKVKVIHGNADWIVPYENSLLLKKQFPENQFELKTIPEASHGLVWSNFELIKKELLKSTN